MLGPSGQRCNNWCSLRSAPNPYIALMLPLSQFVPGTSLNNVALGIGQATHQSLCSASDTCGACTATACAERRGDAPKGFCCLV